MLTSPLCSYSEKQVGYVACSVFLNEKDEFLRLVINRWADALMRMGLLLPIKSSQVVNASADRAVLLCSVRNDLINRNEAFQCLALDFIANGGGPPRWLCVATPRGACLPAGEWP